MSIVHADVAIVGAGPAGSVAAQRLAAAGAQVVLLERAAFPREQPCGDGVSASGLAALARSGLDEWASQFPAPQVLHLTPPDGHSLDVRPNGASGGHCYGRTIPRQLLDARLAQAAVEAGVQLLEKTPVQGVELLDGNGTVIRANGTKITARLVILADGSNASVTRKLGLTQGTPELVAARQYMVGDTGTPEQLEIHFRDKILPGYIWLFPLGNGRVNVGTGTFVRRVRRDEVNLRDVMARFVADPVITGGRLAQAEPVGPVKGRLLRTRFGSTHTHAERILVAGDAAGLVNPLSGEGIAPAMESGELAAAHALNALETGDFSAQTLASYTRELEAHYGADHRAARIIRLALNSPRLLNHIFRQLRRDPELALLVGYIIIGYKSPRLALRPTTLLRLLT